MRALLWLDNDAILPIAVSSGKSYNQCHMIPIQHHHYSWNIYIEQEKLSEGQLLNLIKIYEKNEPDNTFA